MALWVALVFGLLVSAGMGLELERAMVLTQLPTGTNAERQSPVAGGMLRADYGEGARIVIVAPDQTTRVLSTGFASATDPDVSFDAGKIVFAGKKSATDNWNIYEIGVDGSGLRQITRNSGDCRSPIYLSTLYTIVSTEPWYQIAFTSTGAGQTNEYGPIPSTHLYTSRLDGSSIRRLTFNLSSDMDPFLKQDGRLLFSSWQRSTLGHGLYGRIALFGINSDGTDVSLFTIGGERRVRHMACTTTKDLAIFVEGDELPWDGSGQIAGVALRRPLHSYRRITNEADGVFHSPSPLPDGTLLVSRRPSDESGTHGVYQLDPASGELELVFDHPDYHDFQAKLVQPRSRPDGRSSVVNEQDATGQLYGLNVSISDLEEPSWMKLGIATRLRVLEGVPRKAADWNGPDSCLDVIPPLARKRILGDIPIEKDGSFYVRVPANTPIQLQLLDAQGLALRTCSWIWARNREPRGCIGCHEDPELAPENRMVDAVRRPPVNLTLPSERRRRVDFRRDVMPILGAKCALPACHGNADHPLYLGGETGEGCGNPAYRNLLARVESDGDHFIGRYVHPGRARTSPLIWSLLGTVTSRPWDDAQPAGEVKPMPHPEGEAEPLTREEIQTIVEWIDLGALWDGIPAESGDSR
jgi:Tol biopolymer transport system component